MSAWKGFIRFLGMAMAAVFPLRAVEAAGLSVQYLALTSDFRGTQVNFEQPLPIDGDRLSCMASVSALWRVPEADSGTTGWGVRLLPKAYYSPRWHVGVPLAFTQVGRRRYASYGVSLGRKIQVQRFYLEIILSQLFTQAAPIGDPDEEPASGEEDKGHALGLEVLAQFIPESTLSWQYPNRGFDMDLAIGYHF